jgi:hypothetical protein
VLAVAGKFHVPNGRRVCTRGTGALRLHTQLRPTFYGIGTPRSQVCSSVDCFGFKWSLCRMLNLAWLSARASWRAVRLNIADRRFSPRLSRKEGRVRVGLAAGSTAGGSFRSGEVSSSGPPAGSKLNQASAGLNGRGRPSSPKNRRRKHRSLSASMAAGEAVLNHIGSAFGAYPCSCASHFFRFLWLSPLARSLLIVSSESLSLSTKAGFFSGSLRLGLALLGDLLGFIIGMPLPACKRLVLVEWCSG